MLGDATPLRSLLEPLVEELGYELVLVTWQGSKNTTLTIFIDAPGGINVTDCEFVSRQVSDVLDIEGDLPEEYVLEISSPGLDRPLVTQRHFEDVKGSDVSIKMTDRQGGRRKLCGLLMNVTSRGVVIDTGGELCELLYREMDRANLMGSAEYFEKLERQREKA